MINGPFNLSTPFLRQKLSCGVDASRKASLRALKLLALGLFLQGGQTEPLALLVASSWLNFKLC